MVGVENNVMITLKEIVSGTLFWDGNEAYCKGTDTRNNGEQIICYPVSAGEYGNTIQHKIKIWLDSQITVRLMRPVENNL
jgi:hypothetical protein